MINKNWPYLIGLSLILALPILSSELWFSPLDWGKTILFRIILSILVFLFVCQILLQKAKYKVFWPLWLLFALLGVFLLATIFSRNPLYSLLGDPHRAGGFLNFGFYVIFAVLSFLVLRKQDWQKFWNITISIGALVSIVAIFQQYKILTSIFIPVEDRPFSFIGNSVLLALYLLLLVFITFSFLIKEQNKKKALFYFLALLLFIYVILLSKSRAAYFGLSIGFIYFILCYPYKKRIVVLLKILFVMLLILGAYGLYYINTHSKLPSYFPVYLEKNKVVQEVLPRLSIKSALEDSRFSAWVISLEAIKERPLLGYGPENFSIAFDKHYDPLLPYINKDWGSWYDKAHNFLFDIAVTVGIPGLIIFISLFAVLFWKLQRVKYSLNNIVAHGIQATFLAYFANNIFAFDTFSSYLILFLLIGYSLSLIAENQPTGQSSKSPAGYKKTIILILLGICLVWFIWSLNLRPLIINKKANVALELEYTDCEQALAQMEETLSSHSFLDHYLGLKYVNITNTCIKKEPSKTTKMVRKVTGVLEKNTIIRPYYTRNWLYLGIYTNFLITNNLSSVEQADYYFEKAKELSPKRQEIFLEWSKTYFVTKDYTKAKEKAKQCTELSPALGECWWVKALSNIYLDNIIEAKIDLQSAEENRYQTKSEASLLQLLETYLETENYEELVDIHEKLIELEPNNVQYYTSLAYNYKVLGDYENARKTAKKILELFPEMKSKVEEFLKTFTP